MILTSPLVASLVQAPALAPQLEETQELLHYKL